MRRLECGQLRTGRVFSGQYYTFRLWTSVALSRERLHTTGRAFSDSEASALETYSIFVKEISKAYQILSISRLLIYFSTAYALISVMVSIVYTKKLSGKGQKLLFAFLATIIFVLFIGCILYAPSHEFLVRTKRDRIEEFLVGLYSRTATNLKDMAFGMWAILERGGAVNLPAPNYSLDTGDIYRIFAVQIAQITQSLDLLLLAAVRGVPGQPSWVPDWSAYKKHEWGENVEQLQPTNEHGENIIYRKKSGLGVRPTAYFEVDDTQTILTVRARPVCDIGMCFRFQCTNDDFSESERGIHIENLRLMLICATWKPTRWACVDSSIIHEFSFPGTLLDIFRVDPISPLAGRNPQQIQSWISFCVTNSNRAPSQVLFLLRNNQNVFSIQIAMCNLAAAGVRIPFSARSPDNPSGPIFGTCSPKVQVGDQVVRVKGVPQLLIVRAHHDAGRSVKIVSPAVLFRPVELLTEMVETHGNRELEEQYVKYQIC